VPTRPPKTGFTSICVQTTTNKTKCDGSKLSGRHASTSDKQMSHRWSWPTSRVTCSACCDRSPRWTDRATAIDGQFPHDTADSVALPHNAGNVRSDARKWCVNDDATVQGFGFNIAVMSALIKWSKPDLGIGVVPSRMPMSFPRIVLRFA
jgi:hypothetical protein